MNPIRKFLMSIMLILVVLSCHGQRKDSTIINIRKLYKQINSHSTLKTVKLENEQFLKQMTDGGGSLTGFFKGEKLLKIHLWIGLSFGVRQFEYYFNDNGQLFFIYETEEDFLHNDDTGSLDYTKLNLVFEGRYYFDKGVEIEMKNKGKRRFETPVDSKDVISDGKSYAILLKSHEQKTNLQSPISNH